MADVDDLINLIDARDERRALDFVEHHPDLAAGESVREGQLRGATPLHWAAHRNQVRLCQRLLELGADVNSCSSRYEGPPDVLRQIARDLESNGFVGARFPAVDVLMIATVSPLDLMEIWSSTRRLVGYCADCGAQYNGWGAAVVPPDS